MDTPSTYNVCKWARKRVLNRAAELIHYPDKGYFTSKLVDIAKDLDEVEGFRPVDPRDMSKEELEELGFGKWDDESGLYLIPLWLVPFLAPSFIGATIDDPNTAVLIHTADMDTDVRFGCVPYGVKPTL